MQALTQAKQRVANEKKKQNEKKRKAEVTYSPCLQGAHRYTIRGGISVRPSGEQVSLAMDNTNKLVYAEGIVCLATVKRGKG